MADDVLLERVRVLRQRGCSPKAIARTLDVPPAQIAPLIRTIAVQRQAASAERELVGCWVSPGWDVGLSMPGHPEWALSDANEPDYPGGLVGVLVARAEPRGRVSACGYLADVYCLGVKDVLVPRLMNRGALDGFVRVFFAAFEAPGQAAPLELARHLVFGAVDYARGLGFEPAAEFEKAAGHLGEWSGPSDIVFGYHGEPFFMEGPFHNSARECGRSNNRWAGTTSPSLLPRDREGLVLLLPASSSTGCWQEYQRLRHFSGFSQSAG